MKKTKTKEKDKNIIKINESLNRIKILKGKLQEMKEYKNILRADGLEPDMDDKERESELIIKLLREEKNLAQLEGRPIKKKYAKKAKTTGKAKTAKKFNRRVKK